VGKHKDHFLSGLYVLSSSATAHAGTVNAPAACAAGGISAYAPSGISVSFQRRYGVNPAACAQGGKLHGGCSRTESHLAEL
jgi:hypothetical protein